MNVALGGTRHTHSKYPPPSLFTTYYQVCPLTRRYDMPRTFWQKVKASAGKTFDAVGTSASTIDYGLKALELKAFLTRASVITDALNDEKVRRTLQNVVLSDDDSENVQTFMQSFRLQNQTQSTIDQTQPLIRRN